MAGNPQIVVEYVAKTAEFAKGLKGAETQAQSTSSRLKSMGKVAVRAAGAAGLGALIATTKIGIDEFAEAAKVGAQTEATIKSTGGAAKVTAKHVSTLAGALMEKSGMDDEAIQSGENLLLTFTNIRNEAGKGNDIFDQTTKTMVDMSVALGQDTKSSALQLGKALNDPIKGVTALQRVGVSFTQAQKDQIKALENSGHHLEAQKLILGELQKEFGGSAEAAGKTLPGQLNILKQEFNNLAGSLVGTLVPALSKLAGLFTEHPKLMKYATLGLLALSAAAVATNLVMAAMPAIMLAVRAATMLWTAAQWLLNAALAGNPIVLVTLAVIALVAAIVIAYKKVDWFRAAVDAAFDAIKKAASAVIGWLKANWPLIASILGGPFVAGAILIARHWGQITEAAQSALATVRGILSGFSSWLSGMAGTIGYWVGQITGAFAKLDDPVVTAVNAIKGALGSLPGFISGLIAKVRAEATAVADAIKGPINAVIRAWNGLEFHVPKITLPSVKILGKKIGGGSFGGYTFDFPNLPLLAKGAVISAPTLAMVGEGPGREIVTPESLLRSIVAEGGGTYNLTINTRQVDPSELAWGFRRLELLRYGQ